MNEQKHRGLFRAVAGWIAFGSLATLALLGGCASVETPVVSAPPQDWLVEQTAWAWVAGQPEEYYTDREEFFVDPPVHPVLIHLQEQSERYGYDFETLRAESWKMVENVEHVGQ